MPVFQYRSDMAGAPVLSGTQGTLINVLDACLVNGFGHTTPTQITRDGTTVTVGYVEPHNYATRDWIEFSGAEEPEYNGVHRVTKVDDYTLQYPIQSTPTSPATGVFAAKRAPAGFAKPFSGLNKAAYQSTHPRSNKHYLRISDEGTSSAGARFAGVCAYEKMLDIDTGERRFPTQLTFAHPDGAWWCKSKTNDADSRMWHIVSDGITFYIALGTRLGATDFRDESYTHLQAFGQLKTFVPDAYASFLSVMNGHNDDHSVSGVLCSASDAQSPSSKAAPIAIARNFSGHGTIYGVALIGHGFGSQYCLGQTAYLGYPHRPDGRFYVCPVMAYENDNGVYVRGQLPGAYESPHGRVFSHGHLLASNAIVGMEGRSLMLMGGRGSSYSYLGGIWIDMDAEWV
ncbi:hypothetical protein [Comamonas kerstersii]|uniref:hypothetical protein n=1 Tax=Comamonas kerstersii TaxID=225992 RepID=UPI00345C8028